MKIRHSHSLVLIWRLAELEARHLKASNIEPSHLLLGLCKSVDVDLTTVVSSDSPDRDGILEELLREVRRIRSVLRAAGLDARSFRRAYRRLKVSDRATPSDDNKLRRNGEAKQIFVDAEHLAAIGNSTVYPVHLLHALASAVDTERDELLGQLGISPHRLKKASAREAMLSLRGEGPASGRN